MTNEGQKKQFILNEEEARRLASTCSTFCMCYSCDTQTNMHMQDLLNLVGPSPQAQERVRWALSREYECLDECLDLAARFGGRFKEMVEKIRSNWLADDIVKLFTLLKSQNSDELCVI